MTSRITPLWNVIKINKFKAKMISFLGFPIDILKRTAMEHQTSVIVGLYW